MSKTLIILNPHAGGGRAGQLWTQIEPLLWDKLGELAVAVTQRPEEVAHHLDKMYATGLNRVISIGGDGTNHALVNALANLSEQYPEGEPVIYGMFPVGTGQDWARSAGIPLNDIEAAADWVANAQPYPTDIGLMTLDNNLPEKPLEKPRREHFLNIASTGLGGEVDKRVNQAAVRRPWTFLAATVATILQFKPQPIQIQLDDQDWYEGGALTLVVANGTTFGHGMKIAPNAQIDDGLFDVVLVKDASKLDTLMALRRVYDGSHLTHPAVQFSRAKKVQVQGKAIQSLDLDGEYASARQITFELRPGLLHLLR
ncbi:MAG TPA: diacylglycerol kinase family protein [Phototrophicaceae bacterium]|jgi:YegS/Rv2252/BmrU family lipid kinase|nr:diacylglycerol kinase family protein [Phototrophicaceae bacterium]